MKRFITKLFTSIKILIALSIMLTSICAAETKISVESVKTRIGLGTVIIHFQDIVIRDNKMTGKYTIKVPIRPSKNSKGSLILTQNIESGIYEGSCKSDTGVEYEANCEIKDNQIVIKLASKKRKVKFESPIKVVSKI